MCTCSIRDSCALTTAQVIEELIQLAKDIRAARARGEGAVTPYRPSVNPDGRPLSFANMAGVTRTNT
jgi:hypothetical protein